MTIPEGVQTATGEGRDLKNAIAAAASELGIDPRQVAYKLDLSHFRSTTGTSVSRDTVKIIGWKSDKEISDDDGVRDDGVVSSSAEAGDNSGGERKRRSRDRKRSSRDDRRRRSSRDERRRSSRDERSRGRGRGSRDDRRRRSSRNESKPDRLKGPEDGTTEASDYAQEWFETLLGFMDVNGSVSGTGNDERVHLSVKADRAGRIIGKRGSTLGAIRHLLGLALDEKYGQLTIDVDIDDDRPKGDREPRSRRSDRGEKRGSRGGGRRPRREKGKYPEEKLEALAKKAAAKAIETGQTITINLELNSYDRRIVHVAISEVDGVESQSEERVGDDGEVTKYVQVIPLSE